MMTFSFGRILWGTIFVAVILAGCQTQSLSGRPASLEEAVSAIKSKRDLVTWAQRSAEYHASRGDWRSAKIAVTEARFAHAEAEEIRTAAAELMRTAHEAHRRAKHELNAASRDADQRPRRRRSQVTSATDRLPSSNFDGSDSPKVRSADGAAAHAHVAWAIVAVTARKKEISEKAMNEIDRLLSNIREVADQTRRIGRSGRLTRTSPSIPAADNQKPRN